MYLTKRKGVYYWRRMLPDDMALLLGKKAFLRSLRTCERRIANALAARLTLALDRVLLDFSKQADVTVEHVLEAANNAVDEVMREGVGFECQFAGPVVSRAHVVRKKKPLKLSKLKQDYCAAKKRDGEWRDITKRNTVPRLEMFIQLVGDRPAEAVERDMVRDYRDALSDFGLKPSTIGQAFKIVSAMFNWGKREGVISCDNPLRGLAPTAEKSARDIYTPDDLRALFVSPLFTGHWRKDRRETPGDMLVKDHKYWFPLIGLHTGMRLEEIAKLHKADVCEEDGVPVINITKSKTSAGERSVPIHPRLIALGFLEYVGRQGEGHLWPELSASAEGFYSPLFAKWWPWYRRAVGVDREGLVFHSFRHTFVSWLEKMEASESKVALIVGHKKQSITYGIYGGKMITAREKLELIQNLDFGVNLDHLIRDAV